MAIIHAWVAIDYTNKNIYAFGIDDFNKRRLQFKEFKEFKSKKSKFDETLLYFGSNNPNGLS